MINLQTLDDLAVVYVKVFRIVAVLSAYAHIVPDEIIIIENVADIPLEDIRDAFRRVKTVREGNDINNCLRHRILKRLPGLVRHHLQIVFIV